MPLYKITVTRTILSNGLRLERGMGVEVITSTIINPVFNNNGNLVKEAFKRIYGIDLNPIWASVKPALQVTQVK